MDERERELWRRFQLSGSGADEAAWLRERLRAGAAPSDLTLAARLGHPAAVEVLGVQPLLDAHSLAHELANYGRPAVLRAHVALARAFLPEWERRFPRDDRPRIVLEAAENEEACPCARHREAVMERLPVAGEAWGAARQLRALRAAQAALLCQLAGGVATRPPAHLDVGDHDLRAAILAACDLDAPPRVRAIVRAAVVPLLLPYLASRAG